MSCSKVVVLDVVALSESVISPDNTPFLWSLSFKRDPSRGWRSGRISPPFPAVTCVSQTLFLTGEPGSTTGITANGFFDTTYNEVKNWNQSRNVVLAERLFDRVKQLDPSATVFSNCWWHSMHDPAIDYMITPRPQYLSDGRKFPDCYTKPPALRDQLQEKLGKFPLHRFWGPLANIESSQWIAEAAKIVEMEHDPTISLIYLPHLDYVLQRRGPADKEELPTHLREIDSLVLDLVNFYQNRDADVVILSEYGIEPVHKPVHINRILRDRGFIMTRSERGGETLDYGESKAFALAEHQCAHVYVNNKSHIIEVKHVLMEIDGIAEVLERDDARSWAKAAFHPDRSGDLIAVAEAGAWFTYYFWNNACLAPDYAHTVAIHTKPGYDPCEMLLCYNPPLLGKIHLVVKAVLSMFLRLRVLVNATPFDQKSCEQISGSHGRKHVEERFHPVLMTSRVDLLKDASVLPASSVFELLLQHLFRTRSSSNRTPDSLQNFSGGK